MHDHSEQILAVVTELRDLALLIAEPHIAARDKKLREELLRIVGRSPVKRKTIFLMDGTRTQAAIHQETGMNKGQLSTFVKQLSEGKLLIGRAKHPKLAISILSNFFEQADK